MTCWMICEIWWLWHPVICHWEGWKIWRLWYPMICHWQSWEIDDGWYITSHCRTHCQSCQTWRTGVSEDQASGISFMYDTKTKFNTCSTGYNPLPDLHIEVTRNQFDTYFLTKVAWKDIGGFMHTTCTPSEIVAFFSILRISPRRKIFNAWNYKQANHTVSLTNCVNIKVCVMRPIIHIGHAWWFSCWHILWIMSSLLGPLLSSHIMSSFSRSKTEWGLLEDYEILKSLPNLCCRKERALA